MKRHAKIYMDYFNYGIEDFIPCEICENRAVDIHHIENRKSGGDPTGSKDRIENLMGLCRYCHNTYGDDPSCVESLKTIHSSRMKNITNL